MWLSKILTPLPETLVERLEHAKIGSWPELWFALGNTNLIADLGFTSVAALSSSIVPTGLNTLDLVLQSSADDHVRLRIPPCAFQGLGELHSMVVRAGCMKTLPLASIPFLARHYCHGYQQQCRSRLQHVAQGAP